MTTTPFEALDDAAWQRLLEPSTVVELSYGQDVENQGDGLVIVIEGELAVAANGKELGNIGPGSVIGWESIVDDGTPLFQTRTVIDATLLFLPNDAFMTLREERNAAAFAVERSALGIAVGLLQDIDTRITFLAEGFQPDLDPPKRPTLLKRIGRLLGIGPGDDQPEYVDPASLLARSPLFHDAPQASLNVLAAELEAQRYPEGHVLFAQGDPPANAWFLVDGQIDVLAHIHQGRFELLGTLRSPGTVFGTTSLLKERAHSATCVCRAPTTVLKMPAARWIEIIKDPQQTGDALRMGTLRGLTAVLRSALEDLAHHETSYREGVHDHFEELDEGKDVEKRQGLASMDHSKIFLP